MAACETYAVSLISKCNGHPLWEADPGEYPPVELADVGYISQGRFIKLFNVSVGKDDPSNRHGLPKYHNPLHVGHIHYRTPLPKAPEYISSSHIFEGGCRTGYNFRFSQQQGALLIMGDEAYRQDAVDKRRFSDHFIENHSSWLEFSAALGHDVSLSDLILVSGCDRTSRWACAAWSKVTAPVRLSFVQDAPSVPQNNATLWGRWDTAEFIDQNIGPRPPFSDTITPISASLSQSTSPLPSKTSLPSTQCVFVRGFRMGDRKTWFERGKSRVDGSNSSSSFDSPTASSTGANQPRCNTSRATAQMEGLRPEEGIGPMEAIIGYIFEHSAADLALVHDDDFIALVKQSSDLSIHDYNAWVQELAPCVYLDNKVGMLRSIHQSQTPPVGQASDKPVLTGAIHSQKSPDFRHFTAVEPPVSDIKTPIQPAKDSHFETPHFLSNLGISQRIRFERLGELADLEDSISNLREAAESIGDGHPDKPMYLSNLACSQRSRFDHFGDLVDFENAIANLGRAVRLTQDGHTDKPGHLSNLGRSQADRFQRLGQLFDLQNAISSQGRAVELTRDKDPDKPTYLHELANSQKFRFERLGDLSDLDDAISNQKDAFELTGDDNPSKLKYLLSLCRDLETRFNRLGDLSDLDSAILNLENATRLVDDAHLHKPIYLSNLAHNQEIRFSSLGEIADLENAITNLGRAVQLTHDGNPNKADRHSTLGSNQARRFEYLGELLDIDNSITNHQKAADMTNDEHPGKVKFLLNLATAQRLRFRHFRNLPDLAASVSTFRTAAQSNTGSPFDAFSAARGWAETSHQNNDLQSAMDGYRRAIDLLPQVAWLGLDTSSRRNALLPTQSENLGCLAATCAIQLGRLEEAVELLESAQSVFWQQGSALREDFNLLRGQEPELARELERVSQQIDAVNFSSSSFEVEEHDARDGAESDAAECRRLVSIWERLVGSVRQLNNFQNFLRPKKFHQLRKALTAGEAIIIHVTHYGADALIFGATGPIEHVSLPGIDLETLMEFSVNMERERPVCALETQRRSYTKRFLKPALRMIWSHILVQILDKIGVSVTETAGLPRRRIWWYPTGPLTFIPIHAAGPGAGAIDVSRLVISSYMTNLHSLLQSQQRNSSMTTNQLSFLGVSEPETEGRSALPGPTEEVENVLHAVSSAGWSEQGIIHLHGPDATVKSVLSAVDLCSWVHFACHATKDRASGTKCALALHHGGLELGQIASKRLSAAQFAFLSASDTAVGLQHLPGEALHLAAGFQFAGFPSVIAAMTHIRDEDAAEVAYHTYQYLLRNGLQGLEPSDAAQALNLAVLRLREDPGITIDRWAPFVHFGI